jgi:hypothetical protein
MYMYYGSAWGVVAHFKYFSVIIMTNKTFYLNIFSLYCDDTSTSNISITKTKMFMFS